MSGPVNVERAFALIEARMSAMQSQIDALEEKSGALTENINLLRGDKQRLDAQKPQPPRRGRPPAPVAMGDRPTPDQVPEAA